MYFPNLLILHLVAYYLLLFFLGLMMKFQIFEFLIYLLIFDVWRVELSEREDHRQNHLFLLFLGYPFDHLQFVYKLYLEVFLIFLLVLVHLKYFLYLIFS